MNISALKDLTRVEQTLFGLPFLISGALLPMTQADVSFHLRWLWIFPAFMLARVSGMAFNQLIDRHIDAKNPRTNKRALPSGKVTENQARAVAWGTLTLFLLVCFKINTICFLFSPLAAFLLFIYSYLKRVTASCHFVLGMIHFLGPVMASIAISGTLSLSPLFLGAAAALSIMGNDIVYAIQDYEFDRAHNLFSLPSRLGVESSLAIARLLHLLCLVMLIGVGFTAHFPIFYYGLIVAAGIAFYKFHKKVGQKLCESLFFSCTVVVAFSVLGFVLASVIWDVM
ncbi:MAG: 4-hydroxybenzoate octaprenyltransferase [Chlamydiales bacterium]|nr:4-hydroxybenzoate octaprenyltransferase [Chlamydiales bacterium]